MRWVIGVAAFLAPIVIVMSAMAQAPGAQTVEQGAAILVDRIASTIGASRGVAISVP